MSGIKNNSIFIMTIFNVMSFLFDGGASEPIPIPPRKNTEEEYDVMHILSYLSVEDRSLYDDIDESECSTVSSEDLSERYIGDKKEYKIIIAHPYTASYIYHEYTSRAAVDTFTKDFLSIINFTKTLALQVSSHNFYIYRLSKILRKNNTYKQKYTYYVTYKSKKEKYSDVINDVIAFISR